MEEEIKQSKQEIKNLKIRRTTKTMVIFGAIALAAGIGIHIHSKNEPKVEYVYDEETKTNRIDGTVSYEDLKKYEVITVNDLNGNEKYYLGRIKMGKDFYVKDLVTGLNFDIDVTKDKTDEAKDIDYVSSEDLGDYLVTFDEVKPTYTYEDILELQREVEDYKEGKTLTK